MQQRTRHTFEGAADSTLPLNALHLQKHLRPGHG